MVVSNIEVEYLASAQIVSRFIRFIFLEPQNARFLELGSDDSAFVSPSLVRILRDSDVLSVHEHESASRNEYDRSCHVNVGKNSWAQQDY